MSTGGRRPTRPGSSCSTAGDTGQAYWAWTGWDWARLAGSSSKEFLDGQALPTETAVRPFLVALAWLLGGFSDFQHLGMFNRLHLAQLVFGAEHVGAALDEATAVLDRWGYRSQVRGGEYKLPGVLAQALLINRSPRLADLTTGAFALLHAHPAADGRQHQATLFALQKAAASLGYCDPPVRPGYNHAPGIEGTSPEWAGWVERWHATSPLTPKVRAIIRTIVAKAGRWLAARHPEITEPGQWTRETCTAWVAAVDRMAVGDYVQRHDHLHGRAGKPVAPRTKAHVLMATRTFLRDCQEWEWFPRRFDPTRALALPRSVGALIGTDPRIIADDVWAKLLHAGLNIEAADLPGTSAGSYYPMELIRALTLTWLFSGLRSDEISRLRAGCIRWQHDGLPIPGNSREILAADAVCLLDIPVNKTGTAFTKPVDPIIGQAIEAWQALRPAQPPRLDRKTSEHVDLLFSIRTHPVGKTYINRGAARRSPEWRSRVATVRGNTRRRSGSSSLPRLPVRPDPGGQLVRGGSSQHLPRPGRDGHARCASWGRRRRDRPASPPAVSRCAWAQFIAASGTALPPPGTLRGTSRV